MLFCFLFIIILALGKGNLSQDAVHSPTTGSTPKLSAVAKRTNLGFASSNPGTPRVSPHGTPKSQESHNSHTSRGQYSCMTLSKICILYLSPPQRLKGFFSGEEDLLSNVSAGTGLPAIHSTLRLHTLSTADLYNKCLNLCGGERY